jgi:acyl-CoA-binding protein
MSAWRWGRRFVTAQETDKSLGDRPDNDSLLALYSHFKQASDGDVAGERPGDL